MAEMVASAIATKRHLVVQAGTGTGKTLAYLVPAIQADARVVVATATKALQDQLATKDLPFLADHLGVDFDWAVLKGRSNYICLQRLREMSADQQGQLELETMAVQTRVEVKRLAEWSGTSITGDMAELDWTPSDNAWRSVSVGSDECPGADRCPARRSVLCRTGPPACRGGRCDRRQHAPLRPERGQWRSDPSRARRRRLRRGPRPRGHHERHGRRRDRAGQIRRAGRNDPPIPRRSAAHRFGRRDRRGPARRAGAARRQSADDAAARLGPGGPDRRPAPARQGQRVARRHRDQGRGREAAQAARPDDDRPGDRTARRRDRGPRRATSRSSRGPATRRGSRSPRSTSARRCRRACGRNGPPSSPARPSPRRSRPASASRRLRSTWPTSAARSTTRRTRCSTARCTCRTRTATGSAPPSTTSSRR